MIRDFFDWHKIYEKVSNEFLTKFSRKMRYTIIGGTIGVFVIVIACYNLFFSGSLKGTGDNISVQITSGMSTAEIAQSLQEKKIINSGLGFRILARLQGYDTEFKEGIYYFRSDTRASEVLHSLVSGPTASVVRVTIPEGYTVDDIGRLLEEKGLVPKDEFCAAAKDFMPYDYMREAKEHKDIKYAAEGFLFPDTYDFDKGYTATEIMQIMADNFDKKLTADMRQRAEAENLSIFKLIVMASLVEKEAKYEEDRPIIADVFFKRLQDNMPLQSDATIQYALDEHKEEFTIEDTKHDSPYNTYQHNGLTPGPIGNPGIASIEAVLHPADTDYLYFVADSEGHNHYSVTYDEHMETIKQIYGE